MTQTTLLNRLLKWGYTTVRGCIYALPFQLYQYHPDDHTDQPDRPLMNKGTRLLGWVANDTVVLTYAHGWGLDIYTFHPDFDPGAASENPELHIDPDSVVASIGPLDSLSGAQLGTLIMETVFALSRMPKYRGEPITVVDEPYLDEPTSTLGVIARRIRSHVMALPFRLYPSNLGDHHTGLGDFAITRAVTEQLGDIELRVHPIIATAEHGSDLAIDYRISLVSYGDFDGDGDSAVSDSAASDSAQPRTARTLCVLDMDSALSLGCALAHASAWLFTHTED